MTTHYILAQEIAIQHHHSRAKKWAKESGYEKLACLGIVLEAMTERALNANGFTQHKGKATYPRER